MTETAIAVGCRVFGAVACADPSSQGPAPASAFQGRAMIRAGIEAAHAVHAINSPSWLWKSRRMERAAASWRFHPNGRKTAANFPTAAPPPSDNRSRFPMEVENSLGVGSQLLKGDVIAQKRSGGYLGAFIDLRHCGRKSRKLDAVKADCQLFQHGGKILCGTSPRARCKAGEAMRMFCILSSRNSLQVEFDAAGTADQCRFP